MTPTRYRKLSPRVWTDEKFVLLTPTQKLVFLYSLTSRQANRIGLFAFSPAMAAEDLGLALTPSEGVGGPLQQPLPESFAEAFERVRELFGWGWDPSARVLFIPKWFMYNPPEAANNLKGNLADLSELPKTPLIQAFSVVLGPIADRLEVPLPQPLLEGYPDPSPKPSRTQEQEQEQEQEHSLPASPAAGGKKGGGKKPTARKPNSDRPRNPLFDAIAEVCGLDPATAGGQIGKVAAVLAAAAPPYSADDVREFARRFTQICPWSKEGGRTQPTPGEVQKWIGKLRSAQPPPPRSRTAPYDAVPIPAGGPDRD